MALEYANRMNYVKASEIRELLKLTEQPGIISFGGGFPAPELFPVNEMIEISKKVMEKNGAQALQYGPTEGYRPLREAIAKRMKKVQVDAVVEDILVTSGSQQGLDFAAKVFIDPGDYIIIEKPSYLGAINAFRAYEPNFIDIELEDDGMNMEQLEKALKENKKVKFIYVIPDFQNPSGKTWSIEKRKKLVELANKYDIAVVEDNPYGELRYEGELFPAIKHFDTEGRVIFLGTFSKIFCPGLRLGWIDAHPEVLRKFILLKQGADLQSSTISQIEVATFLNEYDIDAHIEKIKVVYKRRRDLMVGIMKEKFPKEVKYTIPEGGLFTWVTLPEHINTRDLAVKALEKQVAFVPGGSFYAYPGHENDMRLNYSAMPDDLIIEGMNRLADVINEALK
ncbi:PLP-dependent aminotransferase family protein [Soehngenia longivitae]|uniref:PLP-dependent aminotransferase family protein n=1 Tax=Soehngenia longivitae TaxID=2562294 RepID=A0A4Z0D2C8_9FIRM|nr:PLP-dependent aminotransferase family protein [Soehngenia longivitae]TFZ39495.1 PLP-dependent aminotransferase family protein [Soehngenia longivitae]